MVVLESILTQGIILAAGNLPIFFLITALATSLWGDASLIFLTIFALQAKIPLWIVFTAAYFGTLLGDSLWFLIGSKVTNKIKKINKINKHYDKIARFLEQTLKNRYLLALTIVKYLYGARVITIFYLAEKKIGYKKFFIYNLLGTFLWVLGVGAIGYLTGIGLSFVLKAFKSLELTITLLILFFIVFHQIQKIINKKIEKDKKII